MREEWRGGKGGGEVAEWKMGEVCVSVGLEHVCAFVCVCVRVCDTK